MDGGSEACSIPQRQADEHNQTGHAAVVGEVEER
jgi:hypothetical protein